MIRSTVVGLFVVGALPFLGTPPLFAAAELDSIGVAPDSVADTSVFHSEMARIEFHKPATWHFAKNMNNNASVRLTDEEFLEAVQRMAKKPLVAATKHEESYTGLNPSFQFVLRPAANMEGKSGVELLGLYIPRLRAAFSDFKVVTEPQAITIEGRSGGRMVVSYAIPTEGGKSLPSTSTLVLVPDGKVVYQFGFSYPREGPDKLTAGEIDQVLGSVKWLD